MDGPVSWPAWVVRNRFVRLSLNAFVLVGVVASALAAAVLVDHGSQVSPGPIRTVAVRPGVWISSSEIASLPTSGAAWMQVKSVADGAIGVAEIRNPASNHDVNTLAAAFVYRRTGQAKYRKKAVPAIMSAIGTDNGGDTIALARNLASYVIAADIVGLSARDDRAFRSWLGGLPTKEMSDGRSLRWMNENRPNNVGTYAGAARAAVAAYLDDTAELAATAQIFKGFLGDRSSWDGFRWGDLAWQCDATRPGGINPVGCSREGHSIDGVLPDDQRRGGALTWPPPKENYVYGALQGAVVQAEILYRRGYATWDWQSRALRRAFTWLHDQANYPASGDDRWLPWVVNRRYGTTFPAETSAKHGKNMGWTNWTHG